MRPTTEITREAIAATETVIRPYVRRTPVLNVDLADFGLASSPVTFKLEMLQHSGSFKVRGAFANLLLRKVPEAGVAAASGGNHGAAVAYAAQRLGLSATIFLPGITSPAKAERIRDYGARLEIVARTSQTRWSRAIALSPRPARCRCIPSIRPRRCSAKGRSAWSWSRMQTSTRCWSRSAAAG